MEVGEGRRAVTEVEVDGKRTVQRHPGSRPEGQTGPDTHEAHPHSRVHCPSHTSRPGGVYSTCRA